MKSIYIKLLILAVTFISPSVFAHQVGSSSGFWSGLSHPILGLDHLLAMVSVGILSAQIGGRVLWQLPLTFVVVMAIGGVLGMLDIPPTKIETGIALSVLVLGAGIAVGRKFYPVIAMIFTALFAIFHGYAHGMEMPTLAAPISYICGFILGTASIHITGVFIGVFATQSNFRKTLLRGAGASIMLSGAYFLLG